MHSGAFGLHRPACKGLPACRLNCPCLLSKIHNAFWCFWPAQACLQRSAYLQAEQSWCCMQLACIGLPEKVCLMTGIVVSSEFFWPAQAFLHKDVPGTGWDDPDTEWPFFCLFEASP